MHHATVLALLLLIAAPLAAQHPIEINPGISSPSAPADFVAFDGNVYFRATRSAVPGPGGLWRTDGTPAGTVRLSDVTLTAYAVPFDGDLLFAGTTYASDQPTDAVYRLSGSTVTEEIEFGTRANVAQLVATDDRLYFTADDGADDTELFVYDGAVVTKVDVNSNAVSGGAPGSAGSFPRLLTPVGDALYFWADARRYDGARGSTVVVTLWRLDANGDLTEVLGLRPDGTSVQPTHMVSLGDAVYFDGRVENGSGSTLYRASGGTAAPVGSFSFALFSTVYDGQVYFLGDGGDGAGAELWRTDGTTTALVSDLVPGATSSLPGDFFEHQGVLYFSALARVSNRVERRLWRTDGTTTEQVPGIDPVFGPTIRQPQAGTSAALFTSLGSDLALSCEVLGLGSELCIVDGASGDLRVLDVSLGGTSAGLTGAAVASGATGNGRLLFAASTVHAGTDLYVYDPLDNAPISTLTVPLAANAERLAFYRNVGLFIDAGDDATGTGSLTMERFDTGPADRTGIPPQAAASCRWELTASGDATFSAAGSRAEVSAIAQPQCFPGDPEAAVMYWRPTVGAGTFAALTTNTSQYATSRILRYTEPGGPGEYVLATSGVVTAESPAAPEARRLALAGPNPASGETRLRVDAPPGERVVVTLHDALGRRVATLHEGPATTLRVSLAGLAPGVYLARMDGTDAVRLTVSR